MLGDLGGTYAKFGQVLALQPDALPIEYCNTLFDLMDRVPAFPYADVEKTFLEDHGRKPAEMFDEFSRSPLHQRLRENNFDHDEFARNIVGNFAAGLSNRARVRDVVQRPDVFIEP